MSFLQQELKKILNLTHCAGDVTYIGSTGYVRVNADVRMRLAFAQSSTTSYDRIVMTMINRKDGPIDTNVLKFKDILGKKPVSNSYFEEGIAPHIWEYREKMEWYAYKPSRKDYQMLADEISRYANLFQEQEATQGPQMHM